MDISSISVIMVIVVRDCVIIDPRLARRELGGGQSPTYPDREKEVGEFCISSLRSSGWIDKQKRGHDRREVKRLERRARSSFLSRYMTRHIH